MASYQPVRLLYGKDASIHFDFCLAIDRHIFIMTQSAGITTFKALTVVIQVAQRLSSAPDMYRVYKQKSTGAMALTPLVSMLVCNHIWLIYAYVIDNIFPLFSACAFGELALASYVFIFARYSDDRRYVAKIGGAGLVVFAIVSVYAILVGLGAIPQSSHQLGIVFGYLADSGSFMLFLLPLEKLKLVLETKSAEAIPVAICGITFITNVMWLMNGIIGSDLFVIVPNIVGIVLMGSQLTVYYIYPPGRLQKQESAATIDVVIDDDDTSSSSPKSPSFESLASPQHSHKC